MTIVVTELEKRVEKFFNFVIKGFFFFLSRNFLSLWHDVESYKANVLEKVQSRLIGLVLNRSFTVRNWGNRVEMRIQWRVLGTLANVHQGLLQLINCQIVIKMGMILSLVPYSANDFQVALQVAVASFSWWRKGNYERCNMRNICWPSQSELMAKIHSWVCSCKNALLRHTKTNKWRGLLYSSLSSSAVQSMMSTSLIELNKHDVVRDSWAVWSLWADNLYSWYIF